MAASKYGGFATTVTPNLGKNALTPNAGRSYDWDNYEDEFVPSDAFTQQEQALDEVFATIGPPYPDNILEVGPGLGRITQRLASFFPSPPTKYALFDVSEAAIEKTSLAIPDVDFAYRVGKIQSRNGPIFPLTANLAQRFDLVVAIEVMLHVPPNEVEFAARNLLKAAEPVSGHLITCDWTEPLAPLPTGEARPVRVENYRHNYPELFRYIGASVIEARRVGLQTIFVVQP